MGASKLGEVSGADPSAVLRRVIWTSTDGKSHLGNETAGVQCWDTQPHKL
jgi:hypothetical protein